MFVLEFIVSPKRSNHCRHTVFIQQRTRLFYLIMFSRPFHLPPLDTEHPRCVRLRTCVYRYSYYRHSCTLTTTTTITRRKRLGRRGAHCNVHTSKTPFSRYRRMGAVERDQRLGGRDSRKSAFIISRGTAPCECVV